LVVFLFTNLISRRTRLFTEAPSVSPTFVETAEALMASTKAEDLADAFAWIETYLQSQAAKRMRDIQSRSRIAHGDQMPQGSERAYAISSPKQRSRIHVNEWFGSWLCRASDGTP